MRKLVSAFLICTMLLAFAPAVSMAKEAGGKRGLINLRLPGKAAVLQVAVTFVVFGIILMHQKGNKPRNS